MRARLAIEGILAWINLTPMADLEHLASNNVPVREKILEKYPIKYKPIADLLIGKEGLSELSSMTDFSVVIDESLRRFPAKGLILWKYKEWTLTNIQNVVNEYLSV